MSRLQRTKRRQKLKKFSALLRYGHAGSGRYAETRRIIWARNMLHAYDVCKKLPGVKKTKNGRLHSVISIEEMRN